MTRLIETMVPVPAHLLEDFALHALPQGHKMKGKFDALRADHRGEATVPVPWFTLEATVRHGASVGNSYTLEIVKLMEKHAPQPEDPKLDEPYLKRLYDGTVSDSRDHRTIGFTPSEFSNAWAVHRGKVFDTSDLSSFHEEFRSWLARHDAELIEKIHTEIAAKLAGDFSSKIDAAASKGVGPIVPIFPDQPYGPVDEHLAKIREIGGVQNL